MHDLNSFDDDCRGYPEAIPINLQSGRNTRDHYISLLAYRNYCGGQSVQ
jgi:hypothetical protein